MVNGVYPKPKGRKPTGAGDWDAKKGAHPYATDFQAGVNLIRIARIDGETNNAHVEAHVDGAARFDEREPLPTVATIVAAVHRRRTGAEVENVWILRVKDDRPHQHRRVRKG